MIEIKISYDPDPDLALENTRFWAPLSLTQEQKHSVNSSTEMERLADELPIEQVAKRWIVASDPDAYDASGDPAHTWYAVYVLPGAWQETGKTVTVACSDRGCLHERTLVNGAILTGDPLKIILVSTQVDGRMWRRIDPSEVPGG